MEVQTRGVLWFILHCLYFSLISIITKHLSASLHIFEIVFFQTFLGSIFLFILIQLKLKEHWHLQHVSLHAWRSFLWTLATVMYFYAIHSISLSKATAVSFSVPLFTSIMAIIWLGEKFYLARAIALLFGIVGMWIVIHPGINGYQPETLWVVGASLLWSLTDIMIKILGRTHHAVIKTFYFAVFSTLFTLPMAFIYWKTPGLVELGWLALLAAIFAANIVAVSKSYQQADLTLLMPFAFTQLIFVAVIAYIIFGEVITIDTLVGGGVIVASASYIGYLERKKHLSLP